MVQVVDWCNKLCEAAWELADYVPANLSENRNREHLWKEIIIPKLVRSLVDDSRARICLNKALSSIQTLATTINENAYLIKQTGGSAKSIEVARKMITQKMDNIRAIRTELMTCESAALELFKEHASAILEIVGPKAANFAQQEAELQDKIDDENKRLEKNVSKRASKKAEIEKLNNLMHVISTTIDGADAALRETKARSAEINSLITQGEKKIDSIPTHTDSTVTTTTYHNRGWWFWRRSWTSTETKTVKITNPNRESEVNYYTGLINARNARLKEANSNVKSEEDRKRVLEEEKASIKQKLDQAKYELEDMDKSTALMIQESETKINEYVQQIHKIREEARNTANLIGMDGSVLLSCLSAIRSFAKAEKDSTLLWQPLIAVLDYITSLSESSVELLSGDNKDVFVGGLRLLKNVGFFDSTAKYLITETMPPESYKKAIENAKAKKFITDK